MTFAGSADRAPLEWLRSRALPQRLEAMLGHERRAIGDASMHVETITYQLAEKNYVGALVHDETVKQPRPALLMCPNWMGMRQPAIDRAALLAQDRYVVFAADMYGEGIRPKDFGEAAALANPLRDDPVEARRRVRGAYDTFIRLGGQRRLINGHRAAVGFCFGAGTPPDPAPPPPPASTLRPIH